MPVACTLVALGVASADDASPSPATGLARSVITASRSPQPALQAPYSAGFVTPADLDSRSPRTFPDALREEPSVMIQKTAQGQGSPYIRGFTGFRTLLLIDGIRLNHSAFRDGPNQYWNTVDPLSIEQIEIVKGPGSVLYGSDAVGGTVNALTPNPANSAPGESFQSLYRVSSAERSHIAHLQYDQALSPHWAAHVGGSWKEFGDVQGGRDVGRQPFTGYNEKSFDTKLQFSPKTGHSWTFAHQTVDQDDAWRTHSTIYGSRWQGVVPSSNLQRILDQDRHLTYLQYHATDLSDAVQEFHASLSHQLQSEDEFRLRSNRAAENQGFDVHTLGFSLHAVSDSPVGNWTYGAEFYRDWVDTFALRKNPDGSPRPPEIQGPVADNSEYDLVGAFIEDRLPLGSRTEFTLGGRYTYAAARAGRVRNPISSQAVSFSDDWHSLVGSGRLSIALDPSQRWRAFAGASQAFRAPNLSDLTRFDIAEAGQIETPAPNLSPENFLTAETGLKFDLPKGWAQAAYFHTWIEDMIIRTPTGQTVNQLAEVTKRNSGEGFIHGVELSSRWELFPQWSVFGAVSWMEGRLETYPTSAPILVREPVSRIMPSTLHASLRWTSASGATWIEPAATIVARQNELAALDIRDTERIPPGGTPGYAVYSIRGGWNLTPLFSLTAAIENLTDEDYRIHGSGLNEPGRNFLLTARLRF